MKRGRTTTRRYRKKRRPFTPAQVRTIKKITDSEAEQKWAVTAISEDTWWAANSTILPLTLVATGDSEFTREGMEIKLHSIQLRAIIRNYAATAQDVIYRIIILKMNDDCGGAVPSMAELLDGGDDIVGQRNHSYGGKFKVYYDKMKLLPQTLINGTNNVSYRAINYYKQFKRPIKCTYDGAAAAIGSCAKGQLFMVLMNNFGADASSPQITGYTYVRFTE